MPNGIMLYVPSTSETFFAVYLRSGNLVLSMRTTDSATQQTMTDARIESDERLDDGEWHEVSF